MEIYFRHPALRSHQRELLQDAYDALSNGNHLLAHAPTGLGKSDAVLGAALTYALKENLTVFFLTPKISQHKIALDVVRGLESKYTLGLRAVDMIGRRYACIDDTLAELDHDGFYYSCQKKRKEETCEFYGNAKGYSPVGEAKARHRFGQMLSQYGTAPTHHDTIALGERYAACPYEWMLQLASRSNVVIADYFHIMIPSIRSIFLTKIKKDLRKSILLVDEGHNLSRRVREQLSQSLNSYLLSRAEKEMHLLRAESLALEPAFAAWATGHVGTAEETMVSAADFSGFLESLNLEKDAAIAYFEALGAAFMERTNRRSACLKLANFLAEWSGDGKGIVRILKKRPHGFLLSKRFLDPSPATRVLNQAHASLVMSGTLLPLEMHRDVLGMDSIRSMLRQYASPFDDDRQLYLVSDAATTRYSQRTFENYRRMAGLIDRIVQHSPLGVALFFPSHNVLRAVVPLLQTASLHVQKEKMTTREVAELLRQFGMGGTLCAVQGGSLAEGVDYSNGEIKTAVIVGVALDEMSLEVKALIDYYQTAFGKGWDYGYLYPGITKALQAAGRGMRKESDRVAVVFLDERFKWKNYQELLGKKSLLVTKEPEKYLQQFWDRHAAYTNIRT